MQRAGHADCVIQTKFISFDRARSERCESVCARFARFWSNERPRNAFRACLWKNFLPWVQTAQRDRSRRLPKTRGRDFQRALEIGLEFANNDKMQIP
jgi:hypothetical protein